MYLCLCMQPQCDFLSPRIWKTVPAVGGVPPIEGNRAAAGSNSSVCTSSLYEVPSEDLLLLPPVLLLSGSIWCGCWYGAGWAARMVDGLGAAQK
jgi:hypothetical protein